jgi:hypothetical protein
MSLVMRCWAGSIVLLFGLLYAPLSIAQLSIAQESMPRGIVRGTLVSWEGSAAAGALTVRSADGVVYGCSYDRHTYFERNHWLAGVSSLAAGDPVEVVADRRPGSIACYVRMLLVIVETPPRRRLAIGRPAESFQPHGNLSFAGVVLRRDLGTLTLKTRTGERTLLLRSDTRYLGEGVRVDPASLSVNMHVFVRAGRNLDGDVEAYQVVWGEILAAQ